jgi:hypothetical protein
MVKKSEALELQVLGIRVSIDEPHELAVLVLSTDDGVVLGRTSVRALRDLQRRLRAVLGPAIARHQRP